MLCPASQSTCCTAAWVCTLSPWSGLSPFLLQVSTCYGSLPSPPALHIRTPGTECSRGANILTISSLSKCSSLTFISITRNSFTDSLITFFLISSLSLPVSFSCFRTSASTNSFDMGLTPRVRLDCLKSFLTVTSSLL